MAGARPIGVTIIGFVVIIEGILGLIAAIFGLFNIKDNTGLIASIILGIIALIYLAVARGLFAGGGGSRLIVGIVTFVSLILGIWTLLFNTDARIQGLIQALIAIIVLMVLYGPRARAFFA